MAGTFKKPFTLRLPATKQTRITQYLKKLKTRRGGRLTDNKKYLGIHGVTEREDFQNLGKMTHTIEMTKIKTLLELGKSVCEVCINGTACGTGFLLFEKFILTNAHVVRDIINGNMQQLSQPVTVKFEELSLLNIVGHIPVEETLTAYRFGCDSSNHFLDYALLQLAGSLENLPSGLLPPGLLSKCSHSPHKGQICIIGHPQGGVKKMAVAFITEYEKRNMAFDKYFAENPGHMAAIAGSLLKGKWDFKEMENPRLMTYDTSFLYGSSGSPVFQDHCQLVSLHTGGYPYEKDGKSYSIHEYAIPIMNIVQDILCELLESKVMQNHQKLDCLKKFSSEALRGSQDIVCMIAWFMTEVLLKFRLNQIYPKALQVLLGAVKGTTRHVKTQLRKALRDAMDTKPSLKGISQQGLLELANTEEEQSSMATLRRFLFSEQRRVLKDICLNVLADDKQKRKKSGKAKGRPGRQRKMQKKELMRL
ncbi:serine protease FAM111A-like isoform X2 [Anguilla rostrata]|uniref:serine protease FAM111A-like isoform X2 n=1 Tax=Anguilla rostrata TaxID=7938 RepID=UPI0030D14901